MAKRTISVSDYAHLEDMRSMLALALRSMVPPHGAALPPGYYARLLAMHDELNTYLENDVDLWKPGGRPGETIRPSAPVPPGSVLRMGGFLRLITEQEPLPDASSQ